MEDKSPYDLKQEKPKTLGELAVAAYNEFRQIEADKAREARKRDTEKIADMLVEALGLTQKDRERMHLDCEHTIVTFEGINFHLDTGHDGYERPKVISPCPQCGSMRSRYIRSLKDLGAALSNDWGPHTHCYPVQIPTGLGDQLVDLIRRIANEK